MFGYVQIDSDELKVREYRLYRAYYCGLCRTLQKRYGFAAKFLLNYDCTFAFILLSLPVGSVRISRRTCPFHPLRREAVADISPESEYAAALNVVLAYRNIEDKWLDDRNAGALLLMLIYRRAYLKAAKRYPSMAKNAEEALLSLRRLEKSGRGDIDEAASCSAAMLSGAVADYDFGDDVTAHIMSKLCADLGRWIYVADAWADRLRDKKKGSYNPVNNSSMDRESTGHLLYTCLSRVKDAFDLLDVRAEDGTAAIADNILCRGCVKVTEQVLADEYKTKRKRRRKHGSI